MSKYLDIQYYILPIYSHKLCFPGSSDGDEMYNVNSPIIRRKLHLYFKKFPIRKISDLDGFTRKFYQTFKEIMSIFLKLLPKIEKKYFEQIPGDSEGERRLVCCSPCGRKESDRT